MWRKKRKESDELWLSESIPRPLLPLKTMDENDSVDSSVRAAKQLNRPTVKPNLNDGIKIAAIYNDEKQIESILISNMENGELRPLESYVSFHTEAR